MEENREITRKEMVTEDDFENYKLHQALYKAMNALKGNK